jgi:uncharacterized protein (TIGR02453 family)
MAAPKKATLEKAPAERAAGKATTAVVPKASQEPEFTGFSKDTVAFLAELAMNNDRDWFKANQTRYEQRVRSPALAFIRAMAPHLAKVTKHFVAVDKKVGGSLMRVQRDTRFGANKEPYKTNVGIQFRHLVGKDVHAPGFYFHIDPDRVFAGVGLWHPEPEALRGVRERVVAKPKEYERAVNAAEFAAKFTIGGSTLVRPPQGFDPNHPLIDVLKRKDHIAIVDLPHRDIYSRKLVTELSDLFASASPFMRFLCQSLALAY